MPEIKLPRLPDRTPVKLALNLDPELHQKLRNYAAFYQAAHGVPASVSDLVPAMLATFIQSDRAFAKAVRDGGLQHE
jgi:hypothetical protein